MASNKQSIPVSDEEVSVSISGTKPGDRSCAASSANPWLIGVVVSLAAFMEVRGTSMPMLHSHTSQAAWGQAMTRAHGC